jgi:sortase (surface protein transpeptidase)
LNPGPDPGQSPVAIRIPDAGVDAEVERQQIVDGQMLDPSGPWVVAWYEQTAHAGAIGNCVMSGHVDYWGVGPSAFHELVNIGEGALIDLTGKDGTVYTYSVTNIQRWDITTVTVDQLNSPDMVGHTDYAALTLVTCGGNFNGQEYTERDLIRGELMSVQVPENSAESDDQPVDEPVEDSDSDAPDGELAVGASATLNTDGANLRAEPTTSADVVEVLANGTAVSIIGGPEDADGYTWWQVELDGGASGWVASDFLTP